ncbi:MAG: DegV family protein, partial [Firmicutes bacterium]|nr:DegV family protein [Bacillota bacterium]
GRSKLRIKFSADSASDLPRGLAERYGVTIVHGNIIMDGKVLNDLTDVTPEDIFRHVEAGGDLPHTSAQNVGDYAPLFEAWRKDYDAVIHFSLSSDMSACHQNACLAAEDLDNVYVVDSKNLSTGISWLILEAVELAAGGASAAEITAAAERRRERMEVSFVLENVGYLYKGGRCSAAAAFGANLLGLKPCIEVKDGRMGVGKKYRGAFDKSLLTYVRDRLGGRDDLDYSRVFITHTRMDTDLLRRVVEEVADSGPWQEVIENPAYCTIANHCGPNTLGVIFSRKSLGNP